MNSPKKIIYENFSSHLKALGLASSDSGLVDSVATACEKIVSCFKSGGKLLLCGNGGSASDANHLAAEFVNRYLKERRPLPAISLASNPANLTSIGNDYSFDLVFSKQVQALGAEGDILIAISTSGKSRNIIEALKSAKAAKIYSILFTGSAKTEAAKLADLALAVPSASTPRIQEIHLLLYHCICESVESGLFEK